MTTLSLPAEFLPNSPNWKSESDEAFGRIRVFYGCLREDERLGDDAGVVDGDSLGGIPFEKMNALEAVAIRNVREDCEGSFASLLLRPSLKLLHIHFSNHDDDNPVGVIRRMVRVLAGRPMRRVETLVLLSRCPDRFLAKLPKLLALLPNLRCLRVVIRDCGQDGALACVVRSNLPRLSELVVDRHPKCVTSYHGRSVRLIGSTLGCEWTLAPVPRGCPASTVRFVVEGRARAEFSSHFFHDKFFGCWCMC